MPAARGRTRGRRPDPSRRHDRMLPCGARGSGLGAAGTAAMLLEPFRVETVAAEQAGWRLRPGSTARSGRAGSSTGDSGRGATSRRTGTSGCGEAARAVRGAACRRGARVARLLLGGAWGWMRGQLRFWTTTARAEIREPRLEMLSSPLVRLPEAAGDEPREEIVAALRGYGTTCWAVHAREDARHKAMTDLAWLTPAWGDDPPGTSLLSTWRHDGVVRLEATAVR